MLYQTYPSLAKYYCKIAARRSESSLIASGLRRFIPILEQIQEENYEGQIVGHSLLVLPTSSCALNAADVPSNALAPVPRNRSYEIRGVRDQVQSRRLSFDQIVYFP